MSDKQIQIIETISMFRMRYAVRTDDKDLAVNFFESDKIDTDMSQCHLGEIISHVRTVNEDEFIEIFDEDNDYLKDWSKEKKLDSIHNIDDGWEFS